MLQKFKKINICIIPESGGKVRSFTLNSTLLLLGTLFIGGLVCIALAASYYDFTSVVNGILGLPNNNVSNSKMLQVENNALESKLNALIAKVADFDVKMDAIRASRLKVSALQGEAAEVLGLPANLGVAEFLPFYQIALSWANNRNDVGDLDNRFHSLAVIATVGNASEVLNVLHQDLDRLLLEADDTSYYLNSLHKNLERTSSIFMATPLYMPIEGRISATFGNRTSPFGGRGIGHHRGLDIPAPIGSSVVSPANGTVLSSNFSGGYGLMVVVDHGYGLVTRYAHLSASLVEAGDVVVRDQQIARSGNSGRSTGPHVHYETILGGVHVDPLSFLSAATVKKLEFKEGSQSLD